MSQNQQNQQYQLVDIYNLDNNLEILADKVRSKSKLQEAMYFPDGFMHALDRLDAEALGFSNPKVHLLEDLSGNGHDLYSKRGIDTFEEGITPSKGLEQSPDSSAYKTDINFDILWSSPKQLDVLPKTIEATIKLPDASATYLDGTKKRNWNSQNDQYWGSIVACTNYEKGYNGFTLGIRNQDYAWPENEYGNYAEDYAINVQFSIHKTDKSSGKNTELTATFRGEPCLDANGTPVTDNRGATMYKGVLSKDQQSDSPLCPTNPYVKLALTLDANANKLVLYLTYMQANGTFVIKSFDNPEFSGADDAQTFISFYNSLETEKLPCLSIGGDWRKRIPIGDKTAGVDWWPLWNTDNYRYFRGTIYSVSLFNTVRTRDEILKDWDVVNLIEQLDNKSKLIAHYNTDKADTALFEYQLSNDYSYYIVTKTFVPTNPHGETPMSPVDVVIPSLYHGLPIKEIGASAFYENTTLGKVTLPRYLKTIKSKAFYECDGLYNIVLPSSLRTIDSNSFMYIDKLPELVLNEGIETLKSRTLDNCDGIQYVYIPASVKTIEDTTIAYCPNLKAITVSPLNANYCSVDGSLYTRDMKHLIQYPLNRDEDIVDIPMGVECIHADAFGELGLNRMLSREANAVDIRVNIPSSVTELGGGVFYNTCKATVNLPDSIKYIGIDAFKVTAAGRKLSLTGSLIGSTGWTVSKYVSDGVFEEPPITGVVATEKNLTDTYARARWVRDNYTSLHVDTYTIKE